MQERCKNNKNCLYNISFSTFAEPLYILLHTEVGYTKVCLFSGGFFVYTNKIICSPRDINNSKLLSLLRRIN